MQGKAAKLKVFSIKSTEVESMGVWTYIRKIILLGPLYKFGNFKDRVHWVIILFFKILLPFYLVLVSEQSEVESYRHHTKNYYKDEMQATCQSYSHWEDDLQFLPDKWISTTGNFTDVSLNSTDNYNETIFYESTGKIVNEILAYKRIASQIKMENQNITRECCSVYSDLVVLKLKCLDQGSATSAFTFTCTMFFPLMANLLVAILMTPLKSSRFLQRKLLVEGNRPSVQLTAEEMIRQRQNGVQYVADILAFYLIVYKIVIISGALKICLSNTYCLPRYKSLQISFLLISSQAPWLSILWSFIGT